MKLTMDEIFGILPVDQDEVDTERTNDWGNITNPNWSGKMKQFSLGLQNSKETVLSNMIEKKLKGPLSLFLDDESPIKMLMEMLYMLIEKLVK